MNLNFRDILPILILVFQVIVTVVVFSFKTTLRNSVLEQQLWTRDYVKAQLDERIGITSHIDSGVERLAKLVRESGSRRGGSRGTSEERFAGT